MGTLTAQERLAFQDSVRRLLADRSAEADVRRTMETPSGYAAELWAALADIGAVGLIVDPEHGGAGAGPLELEAVMEEVGATLLCSPLLSSGVLAAGLLQTLGDAEANARLLPRIADGSLIATAALTGPKGGWRPKDVAVRASADGAAWRLDGEASFVTHGQIAGLLLVVAEGPDGIGVFEVDPASAGVSITPLPTFDHTLRLARIEFQGAAGRRIGAPGWAPVEAALDLARVALAGEQAGGARRVLEFTVGYAKTRIQFGRAIGSYQAIKHMAADLLLESESATSAARHAAVQLAAGAPDAKAAIELAAFACADAFVKVCADAIQMHGGIAFTWNHPAHLYLRRARADAQLFGAPDFHRERFVAELEAAHG
ncbi:MAG: acyl-CoA dehydrogenase family protein [Phenylobacterium sp.]|jgi:alkylation response protein AidB-like acyl-CoA dehydrogenase|uniref:acyl-CoA dehydrogenase family protein n=1 Tax=Phenylobacterium sp. TaxID=1871053 RepID=UPI002A2E66EF|nr:acyl-CoA dehydrogenase family protein [Phenylobacterium sp.]MDD3836893.1 acyl-CoA/acyl-ACP dehydrogenase [Phenylobacterium sp.]MDX9996396.1 acyl-CoA dehydrogenase family protein [Phenylobacterium sp.]